MIAHMEQVLAWLLDLDRVLRLSAEAGCLILVVLVLRIVLFKSAKRYRIFLWGVVALRLLIPVSLESPFSLLPDWQNLSSRPALQDTTKEELPAYSETIPEITYEDAVTVIGDSPVEQPHLRSFDWRIPWLTGAGLLLVYGVISYWRLGRKVSTAVRISDGLYESEAVSVPFLLGLFRPRIYLPYHLEPEVKQFVVAHERAHIQRGDHWWKTLGYVLLAVHWFNPLIWLAYALLCRDLELACDEKVIRTWSNQERADYSKALLVCSLQKKGAEACPLAFGEINVKNRVKSILHYKKTGLGLLLTTVLVCVVLIVCFLTVPSEPYTMVMGGNYRVESVIWTRLQENLSQADLEYCLGGDYSLYSRLGSDGDWEYLGKMEQSMVSSQDLEQLTGMELKHSAIIDARTLKTNKDHFYLVYRTQDGSTYLAHGQQGEADWGLPEEKATELDELFQLKNEHNPNLFDVNFAQRSLKNTLGSPVYCFASYENADVPHYQIVGFKCGNKEYAEMTDAGFAVFYTDGTGWVLVSHHVYPDAALSEHGVYFCGDPAVAEINGVKCADNTFDVVLVFSDQIGKIQRECRWTNKEKVYTDLVVGSNYMSVWPRKDEAECIKITQSVFDVHGNVIYTRDNSDVTSGIKTWFNVWDQDNDAHREEERPFYLDAYPDVKFYCSDNRITADDGAEETVIIEGTRIVNAYCADLSGDGRQEICATVTYGSGIVDTHVVVFDYFTKETYVLHERGKLDYYLYLKNGILYCGIWNYPMDIGITPLEEYPLLLKDSGNGKKTLTWNRNDD